MLFHLPKRLPSLQFLMQNTCINQKQLAKAFQVTERTVYNWIRFSSEPIAVRYTLYYISDYGRSEIHCDLFNEARTFAGLARAQKKYIEQLENASGHENISRIKKAASAANEADFNHDTDRA